VSSQGDNSKAVLIAGPTASGKSAFALELAQKMGGVVINTDSMQVYRDLRIITARPTPEEEARVPHLLYGHVPAREAYSTGRFQSDAGHALAEVRKTRRVPIFVGGTGLYLRAAISELNLRPPPPEGIREHWEEELSRRGAPALHALLAERAPWAAAKIEPGDRQRIVRSLELLDSGELERPDGDSELWSDAVRHPTLLIGLMIEREQLHARIDARVDAMVTAGAEGEVRRANAAGASVTARKALGFEELLAGDVEAMKRRTRNYARRQLTWMRKLAGTHLIDVTERSANEVAAEALALWLRGAAVTGRGA